HANVPGPERIVVDERAVRTHRCLGNTVHDRERRLDRRRCRLCLRCRREQHRTDELFGMAVRDPRQCIPERDHLALFCQADPAVLCCGGHRGDREIRATAAPADRAAAAMEETEVDVMLATYAAEYVLRAI